MKAAIPALIINALIIFTIIAIALLLNQPLAILGLFWLQGIPDVSNDGFMTDAQGAELEPSEYSETTIGFTGKLK